MAATCNAISFTSSVSSLGAFLLRPYSEELELYFEPGDLDLDRDLSLGDLRGDLLKDLRGDLSGDLDSDRRLFLSPRPPGSGDFGGSGGKGGGGPLGGGGGESDDFDVDFPAMFNKLDTC